MSLFAQVPGTDAAIEAASKSGWEAILVVIIVLSMLAGCVFLIRMTMQRKAVLEDALIKLTEKVAEAMANSNATNIKTSDSINRLTAAIESHNGDIRDLCELLKRTAICPYRSQLEDMNEDTTA